MEDERLEFQDGERGAVLRLSVLGCACLPPVDLLGLLTAKVLVVALLASSCHHHHLPTRPHFAPLPPVCLPAGEEVTFSEVVGMSELNGRGPLRVKGCKAHSFHLEIDSTDFT